MSLCLQLYTSAAPWRPSWASWNCSRVKSRTQKTMPSSIWMFSVRAWRIANHGRPQTLTGSTSLRSLRYYEHRTHILMHAHTCTRKAYQKTKLDLFRSSLLISWDCAQILWRFIEYGLSLFHPLCNWRQEIIQDQNHHLAWKMDVWENGYLIPCFCSFFL